MGSIVGFIYEEQQWAYRYLFIIDFKRDNIVIRISCIYLAQKAEGWERRKGEEWGEGRGGKGRGWQWGAGERGDNGENSERKPPSQCFLKDTPFLGSLFFFSLK